MITIIIPFELVKNYFNIEMAGVNFEKFDLPLTFFIAVIFDSLVETIIFQIGILKLVNYFIPKFPIISIFISATLFGLSHSFSVFYITFTFIIGLFLGKLYFFL